MGLLGAVTGRAEAQVARLSSIYALLDKSDVVKLEHIEAALAVWERCESSAKFIFGGKTGNRLSDEVLEILRKSGDMTQSEINNHFKRNRSATELNEALKTLQAQGKIKGTNEKTLGRPKLIWSMVI